MSWKERLGGLLADLDAIDRDELPELLGELARLEATARLRLANGHDPKLTRYLRAEDVAELLSMSAKWVYEHQDELGAVKIGGAVRFRETRVRRWLDARRRG